MLKENKESEEEECMSGKEIISSKFICSVECGKVARNLFVAIAAFHLFTNTIL